MIFNCDTHKLYVGLHEDVDGKLWSIIRHYSVKLSDRQILAYVDRITAKL
jgi:hypothetical protein